MWQFALGFSVGVYVGTYYDCKPMIKRTVDCIKHWKPEERDDNKDTSDKVFLGNNKDPKKWLISYPG